MNTYLVKKEDYQKHLSELLSGFIFRQDKDEFIRIKFFSKKFENIFLERIKPLLTLETETQEKDSN